MAASVITVYRNGDSFQNGKRLVLNRKEIRNFEALLDRVTKDTRSQVAVRSIRTPSQGHRVVDLDKLQNGGIYVAVGPERFKKLEYKEISSLPLHKQKLPEQIIKPVVHSRVIASGRARKVAAAEPTANKTIFVFRNGDDKHPSFKILLDKRLLHTPMDTILQFITEKVRLRTGAVRSMYTLDGIPVEEPSQIKTHEKYVAVGFGKKFVKLAYNENGALSLTPRRGVGPKVKSTSSEPPHRKRRSKPQTKSLSQGNAKSFLKNEENEAEKQNTSSTPNDQRTLADEISNALNQVENKFGLERNQTQDIEPAASRASAKHHNEDFDSGNNESRNREESQGKQPPRKEKEPEKESARKKESTAGSERKRSELKSRTNSEIKPKDRKKKIKAKKEENDEELLKNDDDRRDSTVFKATGEQGESAVMIKENEDTNVDKPIDMLPAEEVDEEIENEDTNAKNLKNDNQDANKKTDDRNSRRSSNNTEKDSPVRPESRPEV